MMLHSPQRSILLALFVFFIAGETGWPENVRYLNFAVKNRHDIYVRDLRAEEIALRVDGSPVKICFFGYKDVETVFVLLLENSHRTAPHPVSLPQWGQVNPIDLIRYRMYDGFFPQMTELGPVLLAEFGREIEVRQDFTTYPDLLVKALAELQPDFVRTGIHDPEVGRAMGRGVDWLRDRSEKRKFLILFTTTVDRESYGNLEEYRDMLRYADIELYIISHAPARPTGIGLPFEVKMNEYFFDKIAAETAGWVYLVGAYTYLDELFTDFKGRLTNNYTIGFPVEESPESREHEIKLEVEREKCRVTYRRRLVY
jgi:hypothetical protein